MEKQKLFSKLISTRADVKTFENKSQGITNCRYDMECRAQKCVERFCQLAHKTLDQNHEVSTPCLEDHQIKLEDLEVVGELSETCSHKVLKCKYLASIGRPAVSLEVDERQSIGRLASPLLT